MTLPAAGRDERGMTLIEVMVAAVILVVGILSMLTVFTSSGALTTKSEREAQAADFAEQQVELLRALPYTSVALNATSADPTWTGFATVGNANYIAPLGTETAVAADATNGKIAPTGTWEDDRLAVRGNVYRYVTWGDDPSIPGTQDFKRIVVAVTVKGAGAISSPITASAVKPDPDNSNLTRGSGGPCLVIGIVCPG
jgi:prepilin-type N-terminal cleavage/methylation domain-containing protein